MDLFELCLESVKPFNKSKNLFFLSDKNMDNKILIPRIPVNFLTRNGYEDNKTKRVCFSTSIDGSLKALSYNLNNKDFYVHVPIDNVDVYKPTIKQVPDSSITNEVWIKSNVKIKCVGIIHVKSDDGNPGIKYKYGDNEADLYGWDWEWKEKFK